MRGEFNNGSAVSRDITRHFLSSFGSETTLGCTRQLTGRLSNARIATPPPDERLVEIGHIAKSPQPGERASCSAWAICLGSAGRLHVARQSLIGERGAQCQESSNRSTRKASITLTGLGKATILCADPGSGVHHVPFDQTTRRRFVTLFGGAALTAATIVAARAQSAAKPARQLAAKTPDAAGKLDLLLPKAKALGAPMAAVERASAISSQQVCLRRRKDSSSWISNRVRPPPTMRHMEEPMDRTQRRPNSKVSKKTWIWCRSARSRPRIQM